MKQSKALSKKEEWLQELVEEIEAIAVETIFNSRTEIIKGKWLIGQSIEETLKDKTKSELYGSKINKILANDLHWSEREIARCRQFYSKYPVKNFNKLLEILPDGKNLSWHKITSNILPEGREGTKEREYISCRVDTDNKIIYIKSNYKEFKVKYY